MNEADIKDFSSHSYSIGELESIGFWQFAPRFLIAAYLAVAIIGGAALLGGFAGLLIVGGIHSAGKDAGFGVGVVAGFFLGIFLSLRPVDAVLPKKYPTLQDRRSISLIISLLVSALPGLFFGVFASDSVKNWFFHYEARLPIPYFVLTTVLMGGLFMSLVSVAWLAIKDGATRSLYIESFREWQTKDAPREILEKTQKSSNGSCLQADGASVGLTSPNAEDLICLRLEDSQELLAISKERPVILITHKAERGDGEKIAFADFLEEVLPIIQERARGHNPAVAWLNVSLTSRRTALRRYLISHNLKGKGAFLFKNGECVRSVRFEFVDMNRDIAVKAAALLES